MNKKNILIIDDSALMRRLLSDIICSDDRFAVKDLATNGLEGLDYIVKNHTLYDAVILDINMPKMNGLEVLEQLQKHRIKVTVLMVSTLTKEGAKETIIALERGAFDFVTKPENYLEAKGTDFKSRLLEMLALATNLEPSRTADIASKPANKVDLSASIEAKRNKATDYVAVNKRIQFLPHKKYVGNKTGKKKLVALACSTGGPKSLQAVIPKLPKDLDAPVVLVQHMPAGFTNSLAQRLNDISQVSVKEAADGEIIRKGHVYIAPGGKQMRIINDRNGYRISVVDEPARDGLRPCANIMYESLMNSDFDEITCVVLTGMGADGTNGIGMLGEKRNLHVIAQNEETCVVYGMPKAIAEAKQVDQVLPLENIADAITKNVGVLSDGR
jgi:two-component system chemotaxis response regulator CheB